MYVYQSLDDSIASELGVSTQTYIEKIEKTTFRRCELIINAILSDDPKIKEKAKRIFNLIE